MKNNNAAVISRLIHRNLKVNRERNFFLVAAIALTTLLLGAAFSIGFSVLETVKVEQMRLFGSIAHGAIGHPTEEQLEQLKELDYIKYVGTGYQIGNVETTPQMGGAFLCLSYFDKTDWEQLRSPAYTDIVGHYPQAEDEVMASRAVLKLLGIEEPTVGMEIPLSYTAVGEEKSEHKTFRLSGWYTSYTLMSKTDGEPYPKKQTEKSLKKQTKS